MRIQPVHFPAVVLAFALAGGLFPARLHAQATDVKKLEATMPPAKLAPAAKAQVDSAKKSFQVHLVQLPQSSGWAKFSLHLMTRDGKALPKDAKVQGTYEMPGMAMDLPPVGVQRLSDSEWQLSLPVFSSGPWKISLAIEGGGAKDTAAIDFTVP